MFGQLIRFLYSNTRTELHSSLTVLVFTGAYAIGYGLLWLIFPLFGKRLIINFEMAGYFIGCIGSGELARGISKVLLPTKHNQGSYLTNLIAGAACIGTFWSLIVIKWRHELWTIPISFIVGALFYMLLDWAHKFDQKFWGNS